MEYTVNGKQWIKINRRYSNLIYGYMLFTVEKIKLNNKVYKKFLTKVTNTSGDRYWVFTDEVQQELIKLQTWDRLQHA